MTSQKYCIEWDQFESSLSRNYSQIRQDDDNNFSDVTLVSDDEDTFPAHKFVLAGSSSFFQNILKKNPHPVPLLYLSGVSSQYLKHALDFIYEGKVEIDQQNLHQFLSVGEKLKISGLLRKSEGTQSNNKSDKESTEVREEDNMSDKLLEELYSTDFVEKQTFDDISSVNKNENLPSEPVNTGQKKVIMANNDEVLDKQLLLPKEEKKTPMKAKRQPHKIEQNGEIQHVSKTYCYEKITITDVDQIGQKIEELSEKVGGVWRCTFCGKTTASHKKNELGRHIESHFEGLSYGCTLCDKTCKNRTALRGHMYREHKAVPDPTLQPTITPVSNQLSEFSSLRSAQYMNMNFY